MKNEIITNPDKAIEAACAPKEDFRGYTIEELRYQRALVALQKEFCKSKVLHRCDRIRNRKASGSNGSASNLAKAGAIASKVFSGLNYLDYIMIGMSVFGSARKIFKFVKGKRR